MLFRTGRNTRFLLFANVAVILGTKVHAVKRTGLTVVFANKRWLTINIKNVRGRSGTANEGGRTTCKVANGRRGNMRREIDGGNEAGSRRRSGVGRKGASRLRRMGVNISSNIKLPG